MRASRWTATEAPAVPPAPDALAMADKLDELVQIIMLMTAAERKALRRNTLDQDTTARALAEKVDRDVLRRHGHNS